MPTSTSFYLYVIKIRLRWKIRKIKRYVQQHTIGVRACPVGWEIKKKLLFLKKKNEIIWDRSALILLCQFLIKMMTCDTDRVRLLFFF